jgi:hypothetical protein
MSEPSKILLRKALCLLADEYDLDEDCFFVVVTKDGKNPTIEVTDQKIIGEINLKTLVAFMVRAIHQFCGSVDINPHIFVSRYLTGALLDAERDHFCGLSFEDTLSDEGYEDEDGLVEEEDDEEDDEIATNFVFKPHWTEIEN